MKYAVLFYETQADFDAAPGLMPRLAWGPGCPISGASKRPGLCREIRSSGSRDRRDGPPRRSKRKSAGRPFARTKEQLAGFGERGARPGTALEWASRAAAPDRLRRSSPDNSRLELSAWLHGRPSRARSAGWSLVECPANNLAPCVVIAGHSRAKCHYPMETP